MPEKRPRQVQIGKTIFRLIVPDRGYGGPYGQDRLHARWACIWCGRAVIGDDSRPYVRRQPHGRFRDPCADNGHAPCRLCGTMLPRLQCGCPREHKWNNCPAKTKADKLSPQHNAAGHNHRPEPGASCSTSK